MRPARNASRDVNDDTVTPFAPRPANWSPIMTLKPWMIEIIAMTDATPITMPSVVRKLRKLCARIEPSAARAPSVAANQMGNRVFTTRRARGPRRSMLGAAALIAPVLQNLAVLQAHDALPVRGDVGLVRDDDDRLTVSVQLVEQREDLGARLRVEVTGRLVGEQARRIRDERARDRDALALAARELIRQVVGAVCEPHAREHALGLGFALGQRQAAVDQRLHDVLQRAGARQQIEALKDEPDFLVADVG